MRDLIAAAPSAGSVGCRLCFEDGVIGRPPPHPIWTKRDALRTPNVGALFLDTDPRARWASALISSTPRGAPAALLPPGRPRPALDEAVAPQP
jgi:hypothetical protein